MRSIFWAPPCGPTGKIKKEKKNHLQKSKWFVMSALPFFRGSFATAAGGRLKEQ